MPKFETRKSIMKESLCEICVAVFVVAQGQHGDSKGHQLFCQLAVVLPEDESDSLQRLHLNVKGVERDKIYMN